METPDFIYDLIIQDLNGEISSDDKQILSDWVSQSEENRKAFEEINSIWLSGTYMKLKSKDYSDKVWAKIRSQVPQKQKRIKLWPKVAVAASLLLVAGLFTLFKLTYKSEDQKWAELNQIINKEQAVKLIVGEGKEIVLSDTLAEDLQIGDNLVHYEKGKLAYDDVADEAETTEVIYHELVIPNGGKYELTLADGTLVILNAESRLRFPSQFHGSVREVWVKGEAYFDVHHNPQQPFVVHSNGFDTRVLGTEFNVRTYANEDKSEVTLVQGSVQLSSNEDSKMLVPGKQFVMDNEDGFESSFIQEVETYKYTAWTTGLMYFDNVTLEDLLKRLSRWYSFDYEFEDEALKDKLYSGGIKKGEDLRKVFGLIEKVNDVQFNLENNTILIEEK